MFFGHSSLSSISEQYLKFEYLSLRQQVSTAEKSCNIIREIHGKGRLFATFGPPTGPAKMTYSATSLSSGGFFSEAFISSPVQEFVQANGRRSHSEPCAKAN